MLAAVRGVLETLWFSLSPVPCAALEELRQLLSAGFLLVKDLERAPGAAVLAKDLPFHKDHLCS